MIENNPKDYGFVEPKIDDTHYVFGSGQVDLTHIIQPDGQWDKYIPTDEFQNVGFETDNCTGFGSTNVVEILMKKLFGVDVNYDDRVLGIMAGTSLEKGGNDPQVVMETIRKQGLVNEGALPKAQTQDEYYKPNPLPSKIIQNCKNWLFNFAFKHDWVASGSQVSPDILKTALQYSPLGVGVYAWAYDNVREVYVRMGNDTHWTVLYGYKENAYWKIFDSYDNTHKKLDWNFGFKYVKRISIEKAVPTEDQLSIFQQILNYMAQILQKMAQYVKNTSQ